MNLESGFFLSYRRLAFLFAESKSQGTVGGDTSSSMTLSDKNILLRLQYGHEDSNICLLRWSLWNRFSVTVAWNNASIIRCRYNFTIFIKCIRLYLIKESFFLVHDWFVLFSWVITNRRTSFLVSSRYFLLVFFNKNLLNDRNCFSWSPVLRAYQFVKKKVTYKFVVTAHN